MIRRASSRRDFLQACGRLAAVAACSAAPRANAAPRADRKAQIAITLDLEMSREYPQRGQLEWDYEKGNLDDATKQYAVEAARVVKERGGVLHFFCVGRVLEQPDVTWLKEIAAAGHPIGNHTYDHVYLLAKTLDEIQFRFQRAPWLIADRSVDEVVRENIQRTTRALQQRCGIAVNGFRTPGGFATGLHGREDLQRMLLEAGFSWVSSMYPPHPTGTPMQEPSEEIYRGIVAAQAAAQPFRYPSGLFEIPMSPISDVNAFRTNRWKLDWFLEAIRRSVEHVIEHGGTFDFLAHPSVLVVEDPEFRAVKLVCDLVNAAKDRAEVVGLDRIAAAHA